MEYSGSCVGAGDDKPKSVRRWTRGGGAGARAAELTALGRRGERASAEKGEERRKRARRSYPRESPEK